MWSSCAKPMTLGMLVVGGLQLTALGGCSHGSRPANLEARAALVRKEATADNLEQLGIAAAVAGDASRAEQYFSAAMVAGGDTKRLTERLMHICITEKRYPVAVSYAESYLVRNPKDAAIRYAMGTIYMALGETGKAIDALERSVEDKPELADAHYALASALQSRGMDPVRADEHFRTYLRLSPQGPYAENARGGLLKSVP